FPRRAVPGHAAHAVRRRRGGRGLGPFTSTQLTTVIVTLAIVIGFPFAAFAVTGSNVFVTDATTGTHAKVDSSGQVLVGDGSGALTVDGTVNNRQTLPSKPIVTGPKLISASSLTTVFGPVNKAFAITSLTIVNECGCSQGVAVYTTTSTGGQFQIEFASLASRQTLQLTYPSPLIATPPAG